MKVIEGIAKLAYNPCMVVTSGTFDGVHLGHQKILQRVTNLARENQGKSAVITFWPHPRYVLGKAAGDLKLLSTWDEKQELLTATGIDYLVKIPFTKEFSELSGDSFIRKVLVDAIGTRILVIGYDHRFGKNREGSFEYLRENALNYGFEVVEIPRLDVEHVGVSSSKIRQALLEGNVAKANEFLGYEYALAGTVVKGDRIGTSLGYPTANLQVHDPLKLVPADGIYAVHVSHEGNSYDGMLYIGNRPTLHSSPKTIEVNIFNFDKLIYGESLKVSFVEQLRQDQRFASLDELKKQLGLDRQRAIEILSNLKHKNPK